MIDTLENRILLALATSLDKGILTINGTEDSDAITVGIHETSGRIVVDIDDITLMVPPAKVKKIRVNAGPGSDRVVFSSEINIRAEIYGGPGNDLLQGGDAACKIVGEDGHDTLIGGSGADIFIGGKNMDTVDYRGRAEGVTVTLDNKPNDGAAAEKDNVASDVERIIGGDGDDILVGSPGRNTIQGGNGNDTIQGGGGDDVLVGAGGADSILGGDGDDLLLGIDVNSGDSLDGGEGYDGVTYDEVQGVADSVLNCEADLYVLQTDPPDVLPEDPEDPDPEDPLA